ncbi:ileal sodium/bile acid cotransporter-like [Branchiostoma lanceolatum]|uniref:ileal sodium/bile acid cotransporter-like n=1 Tax=Branchiostoma lanceolatum TaxID=7740 RepID=UPI003457094D
MSAEGLALAGPFPNQTVAGNQTAVNNGSALNLNPLLIDPMVNLTMNIWMSVFVVIMMLSLGCTMEYHVVLQHIKKPFGMFIGFLSQFVIMPALAYGMVHAVGLGGLSALTVLILGCCPGGKVSNILALLAAGDMNLSICMTVCSTTLAMGMMPLCLWLYGRKLSDSQTVIPYDSIGITLVCIIVPVAIGVYIKYRSDRAAKIILRVGGVIVLLQLVIGMCIAVFLWGIDRLLSIPRTLIVVAVVMPFCGYVLGYIMASVFRLPQNCRRTVSMETGCQNSGLCMSILKLSFPVEEVGTVFFFPPLYAIFQTVEALIFIVLYHVWARKCGKEKGDLSLLAALKKTGQHAQNGISRDLQPNGGPLERSTDGTDLTTPVATSISSGDNNNANARSQTEWESML